MSDDYQKIIEQLEILKDYCTPYSKALQEAIDIISDYERIVSSINSLIQKYEQTEKPTKLADKIYTCPHCGKRTQPYLPHCHYCGKKLGWK